MENLRKRIRTLIQQSLNFIILLIISSGGCGLSASSDTGQQSDSELSDDQKDGDASVEDGIIDGVGEDSLEYDSTAMDSNDEMSQDLVEDTSDVSEDHTLVEPTCDSSIGWTVPLEPCSQENPCTNLLPTYDWLNIDEIGYPSELPECFTNQRAIENGRNEYNDGAPKSWVDPDGVTRYWCEYRPQDISSTSKRPLVIYVTGSGGRASDLYNATSLRNKAEFFDLSGDQTRPGFILVSAQPRYLHWLTSDPQDGTKHDTYHRSMGQPSSNLDIRFYDNLIDRLAQEGIIDTNRIYFMGWSNGARFAALYGIARHRTTTSAGYNIAAIANYSGGDPFENIQDGYQPSCKIYPYPTSSIPFLLVSRSCDGVACNETQAQMFRDEGTTITPGNVAETWIEIFQTQIQNQNVDWLRIDGLGNVVNYCNTSGLCTIRNAVINHMRWPDGVADTHGNDHEPHMLDFLRNHPL